MRRLFFNLKPIRVGVANMKMSIISQPDLWLAFFVFMMMSCGKKEINDHSKVSMDTNPPSLFTLVSPQRSKITFRNDLKETNSMNGIFYEYFYNGSGVAVGDFNNDGWEDIYLVSTLSKNRLYLNKKALVFEDVTDLSGADSGKGFDAGVTVVDINRDGLLDIYVCRTGRFKDDLPRRNALMINQGVKNGIPHFKEMAADYGLDDPSFSTQAGFFDYDRDGDLDMFLINHGIDTYPDNAIEIFKDQPSNYRGERLYRNDNNKFIDVTQQAGIINNMLGYGLGLAFGDLNNDQWPDIYVSNDFSGQDHLYINQQDGSFSEVAKKATRHISNFSMGNDIADFNNDGWLDIVVVDMMAEDNYGIKTSMSSMDPERFYEHVNAGLHYQYMYNTLQLNNGLISRDNIPKFSDVAQLAGISSTDWSWAPLFVDMDNDGDKDLFISNGIKRDFRNNDFVNYRNKREQALKSGDITDKKSFVSDLLNVMPSRKKQNYFYVNAGNLKFEKMPNTQAIGPETNSNGAANADFDLDGDIDFVMNNVDNVAFIYENHASDLYKNHYIKIKLVGSDSNPEGIGSRIKISQGKNQQIQELYVNRGFQSAVSQTLHFGLGDNSQLDQLSVIWPDGSFQTLSDIGADNTITLRYEDASAQLNEGDIENFQFKDLTRDVHLRHKHIENEFDDFGRESLLPHKMSALGPGVAIGDVNADGLDDFFVGGALGKPGVIFTQNKTGDFMATGSNSAFITDKAFEDTGCLFFDVEGDGDLDLYVASGGNEYDQGSPYLQDRLYINNGAGDFQRAKKALPSLFSSSSRVRVADFDGDGDQDLFVGGRQQPGKYPLPGDSYLLRNDRNSGEIKFTDVTQQVAPMLKKMGMVTDAVWVDIDGDRQQDLVVVGEWMPIKVLKNTNGHFSDVTKEAKLDQMTGWWYSVAAADIDRDGDLDLVAGNLGLNYKYKANHTEPFEIFAHDFDDNGSLDIVLGYHNNGHLYPLRGRECSSGQTAFIKEKFPTYNAFGNATLEEVYGIEKVRQSLHYQANTFATCIFKNNGIGGFSMVPLDNLAQVSSVNAIVIDDINEDGYEDLVLAGNLYHSEVETPRNDAGYGMYLKNDGNGSYNTVASFKSGLYIDGNTTDMALINLSGGNKGLLAVKNSDSLQVLEIRPNPQ